jgi:metallo-beta-lactamase class B
MTRARSSYDHAGGIAGLARASGVTVVAMAEAASVLESGASGPDDPQFGSLPPIDAVKNVRIVKNGETLRVGSVAVTAHATGGHTPGGASYSWRSCQDERCLDMVYADSVTAVSADGFLFTRSKSYPDALADFERSFATLSTLPCDVLLTPHPEASGLLDRAARRAQGITPDPLIDPTACQRLVGGARKSLADRIGREKAAP